jgi:Arc/MetJ family transcription regulator
MGKKMDRELLKKGIRRQSDRKLNHRCILCIVRRTQLYLDDDLWTVLQVKSRQEKTTVSDLVRRAVRERYLTKSSERYKAMTDFIVIWKDRDDIGDSTAYVRELRKDRRSKPLP